MKVYICGNKHQEQTFHDAEIILRKQGHIPINPVKILYALPEEISNSDFTAISFEIIRISDAVLLVGDWEKDLLATMELAHAKRIEKEIFSAQYVHGGLKQLCIMKNGNS